MDYILKQTHDLCLFVYGRCRNTHALRGFRGSGHNSAECEELWTRLTWHYLAPEMQQTDKHTLLSHTLNFTVTHASVSARSQQCMGLSVEKQQVLFGCIYRQFSFTPTPPSPPDLASTVISTSLAKPMKMMAKPVLEERLRDIGA